MTSTVVRVVVNGWTWLSGEADNATLAKAMLLGALEADGWPQVRADVTITPGGFIRAPFPDGYDQDGGARGWGSDDDFERLTPAASKAVERVIADRPLMTRLRGRTRLLTLGVDLIGGTNTRAELVAVFDTEKEAVVQWTGKSYPAGSVEERHLVQAPLENHLLDSEGTPILILGCHDLNLFSERARANQAVGSVRRRRCDAMRKLAKEFKPVAVLQHPHTTDSPKIWSVAWAGVRRHVPTAETLASGIAYCRQGNAGPPRAPIETVMEQTAWGAEIGDVVVEGHW